MALQAVGPVLVGSGAEVERSGVAASGTGAQEPTKTVADPPSGIGSRGHAACFASWGSCVGFASGRYTSCGVRLSRAWWGRHVL